MNTNIITQGPAKVVGPEFKTSLRKTMIVLATAAVLLGCGAAFSQIGTGAPVPSPLGITSPLGMAPGSPVPPAGIPLGNTELTSPGLSPAPAATIGMTGNSTTCPVTGSWRGFRPRPAFCARLGLRLQ